MIDFDELEELEELELRAAADASTEVEDGKTHGAANVCSAAIVGDTRSNVAADCDPFAGTVQAFQPLPKEEFQRLPKPKAPGKRLTPKQLADACQENLPGEFYGIEFPHSHEQLRDWGPEWLTKALHLARSLPQEITVQKFVGFRVLGDNTIAKTGNDDDNNWGGAGVKVLLDVEYDRPADGVHSSFFIKLPHKYSPKNERHKISCILNNDFPEIMFNHVFANAVPFRTPKCYFADMNRTSTNFILICEKISYADHQIGDGEEFEPDMILPAPGKYQDFKLLRSGVDHYYAQARAFARMCAWYQRTRAISSQVDELFAHEDAANGVLREVWEQTKTLGPMDGRLRVLKDTLRRMGPKGTQDMASKFAPFLADVAKGFIEYGLDFLEAAPQLFPEEVRTASFRRQFEQEAKEFCDYVGHIHCAIVKAFPELHVLAHVNLQVDNAFYWFDLNGQLQAGLLDWGSVTHGTAPGVLASGWHGAEVEIMDEHEDRLCGFFVDELLGAGGTCCDKDTFRMFVKCVRGASMPSYFANLTRLYGIIPKRDWTSVKTRFDPRLNDVFLARCYAVAPVLVVSSHRSRNPTPALRKLKELLGIM